MQPVSSQSRVESGINALGDYYHLDDLSGSLPPTSTTQILMERGVNDDFLMSRWIFRLLMYRILLIISLLIVH